jgi:signal transduction histidine kinase/ligand-binding sensor domain-containing protein/DNA-binding response OmpR family regulator
MNIRKAIGFCVCFLLIVVSYAQSSLRFERFSTLDGLGNNAIFDIATDSKGKLWLATYDGLSCFDGYQFKNYKPDITNPGWAGSNIINVIKPDSSGKIWFGTAGTGLSMLNPETKEFRNYQAKQTGKLLTEKDVSAICNFNDKIWFGTASNLNVLDQTTDSISNYSLVKMGLAGSIRAIQPLDQYRAVIATSSGIAVLEKKDLSVQLSKSRNEMHINSGIIEIKTDEHGQIIVVTDREIQCLSYSEKSGLKLLFQIKNSEIEAQVKLEILFKSIIPISESEYWIVTSNGLISCILNQNNRHYGLIQNKAQNPESLSGNKITSICKDREQNIWLGTRYNGLSKYDPRKQAFKKFTVQLGRNSTMQSNDVRSLCQDHSGNIWIGYRSRGLDLFDSKNGEYHHFEKDIQNKTSLPSNVIRGIYQDSKGQIWIGSSGGLSHLKIENKEYKFHTTTKINGRDIGSVYEFYEDSKNRFWLGTTNGLLLYSENEEDLKTFKHKKEQLVINRYNFIRCITEDKEGNIWLATDGGGIDVIDPEEGYIRSYNTQSKNEKVLSHNKVYCLLFDSQNRLWAGTHNGLNLMVDKAGNFKTYTQANGLVNDVIYSVQEDAEGNLWISTANGLSKFDPKTENFQNYLQGFEFSDDAWSKNQQGELLLGGLNGFFRFHPKDIQQNDIAPLLRIEGFRLQNKILKVNKEHNGRVILTAPISELQQLDLKHDENFFSLNLLAISLSNPNQVRYKYQLVGFNNNWIELDADSRTAHFTNVPHGDYEFMFKAANADGIWSDEAILKIVIHPAFYQTIWFKIGAIIFIILTILSLYWLRLRSLTRHKERLEKEVDEKTSVLRSQNKAIEKQNRLLESQKKEIETQRDKVVEMTRLIHETDERKIKFFTSISHEIRTPLTLIAGPVEKLLESLKKGDKHYSAMQLVERNTNRLLKLVNQLLDFRKIDTGYMPIRLIQSDFLVFVKEVFTNFQVLAVEKNIDYQLVYDSSDYNLFFDADVLEKVIANLLSNAIKYTQLEGRVCLSLKRNNDHISITVQDNGPGVLPGVRKSIFKRFFRIEEANSISEQGTGIGLSLAKEMAILHGGDLSIIDLPERGSCFRMRFPVIKDANANLSQKIEQEHIIIPEIELKESKEDYSVLVVEDNSDLRSFIKDSLEVKIVLEAVDGESGINMAVDKLPDLIISDVLMPGKNGFELCRILKEDPRTNHIPILLLTALGAEEHQQTGIDLGADDYILKPFNHQILSGKVNNILQNREHFKEKLRKNLSNSSLCSDNWKDSLPPFVIQIIEHIENNLQNREFGVEDLGQLIGMSQSTLYRKMKAITNKSTVEFIREVKIRKSLELLKTDSNLQVGEVAFLVGFEDVNYFRKCFKKQFGKSPKDLLL